MNAILPPPFLLMEIMISVSLFLQTIEFLQLRMIFSATGIWSWEGIAGEFRNTPGLLKRVLSFLFSEPVFLIFLALRLVASIVGFFCGSSWLWGFQWIGTVLIAVRWRGTFNGGSDYMTLIVLLGLFVGRAFGEEYPRWILFAFSYIGIQVALSYFSAGISKIRHPEWRTGRALSGFLRSDYYGSPQWIKSAVRYLEDQRWIRYCAWILLAFEVLFPIALFNPHLSLLFIGLAIFFQSMNVVVFGLNRFIWAWGAAYPAVYWCSQHWR